MKYYLLIITLFILTIALTSYVLINPEGNEIDSVIAQNSDWNIKEKEIISRLLSVPILLYHDIDGKGIYSVTSETLRSHFQLLRENDVRVIPLSELTRRLSEPEQFDEKVIVISFDDGFLSMYTRLLPLINEFGYPITLFVYTDNVYSRAKKNMTWKRLRKMEESGINVECHSISHADLEELSKTGTAESKRKLFKEIYLSKRIIELYMRKKVKFFAFPYGRYDLNTVELCRFSGYNRAFSTDSGSNIITRNNYCLRRQHIKRNFSLDFFKKKIK